MKTGMRIVLVMVLCSWAAACVTVTSKDRTFKKASPEVQAQTNMQLAIEYMKLDKMQESKDAIERALGQNPGDSNVQMTAGVIYERLNSPAKAERAYAAMYRLKKDDPNVENTYAGYLCRSGKPQAGEKLFVEVAKSPLYTTPEVALTNAGVCVRGTGDLVDAQGYFTRALAIHPNFPEAMLQLGNIALDRGDAAEARDWVGRYLAANPATPEILWLGVRAERKLGNSAGAAAYARRVQTEFPSSEQAQMLRAGVER